MDVRPSPIAGQWYPSDPDRLASLVDTYLDKASLPALYGDLVAVMAPHAGHRYSGPVAGHAFAALRDSTAELVAVVSPMHYAYAEPLLTTAHTAYQTPLGTVPVDQESLQRLDDHLAARLGYGLTRVYADPEHSLEIELPFLQRALGREFRLLPVMVRAQSSEVAQALGQALAAVLKDRPAVLVASTDLSHFYPQRVAEALDSNMLRRVQAFDPAGVMEIEEQGKGFACGRAALAAVLWAARALGADTVQILRHATSGDVTGDYERVVGYAAAAIFRSWKSVDQEK